MNNIGKFIKQAREANNYSQQKLADKLFVSKQALSFWELGKRELNLNLLTKLSQLLNFKILIEDGVIKMELNNNVLIESKLSNFDLKNVDIEMEFEKYSVIKLYTPFIEGKGEIYIIDDCELQYSSEEDFYMLDINIFDSKKEFYKAYPNAKIQTFYTLIDNATGLIPTLCHNFYPRLEILLHDYYVHYAPVIAKINNQDIYEVIDEDTYLIKVNAKIKCFDDGKCLLLPLDVGNFKNKKLVEELKYDLYIDKKHSFAIVDKHGNLKDEMQFAYPFYLIKEKYEKLKTIKKSYNLVNTPNFKELFPTLSNNANSTIDAYNKFINGEEFKFNYIKDFVSK